MEPYINRDTDGTPGKSDQARKMDTEMVRNKTGDLGRTKDFVQAVINKRMLRLNMPIQMRTESAPTSPVTNVSEVELVWDEEEARSVKRRRGASFSAYTSEYYTEEDGGGSTTALASKVRRIIKEIGRETKVIVDSAKERNTKREIKEAASALESMMSQIQTSEIQALLQSLGRHQGESKPEITSLEERLRGLEEANKELQAKNKALEKEVRELIKNGGKRKMKDELFVTGGCYEDFVDAETLEWPDNIYKVAFWAEGSPLKANRESDLLFLKEENPKGNVDIAEDFLERYPDLNDLEEKVAAIRVTTKKIKNEGEVSGQDRWVFKIEVEEDAKELFEALKELRLLMRKGDRKKIAVYPPGWDGTAKRTRRMLEWVFRNSGVKCLVYTRTKEGEPSRPNKRRGEALIVKHDGNDYAEALKVLKERIRPESSAAKAIRTIREAKDGSMVVVLNKDSKKHADDLRSEIKTTGSMKIVKDFNDNNMTLFVSEIDVVTTKEEICEVLCREAGLGNEQLQVSDPRRSFGGNNTVAVSICKEAGATLLDKGGVRIGLSWCPIKERVEVLRCFRCWQYGHIGRDCRDRTDSSKLCRRCGEEGHQASNCDKEERCLTCKRPGHSAGSGRCPEFRKAVMRERLNRKNKKRY